mmetsp:Transcript_39637/g.29273  ORF Transcript_39637/g.29273 Transcript_39637/m.29273 type:complete len:157 (+) Transcript_39637:1-471(+)
MTSVIPNRPPDTPKLSFYGYGEYPKQLQISQFKNPKAYPGQAANIVQRNKRGNAELEVKPYSKSNLNLLAYNPKHYLRPFDYSDDKKNVSLNSLHATAVFNRRLEAENLRKNLIQTPQQPVSREAFKKAREEGAKTDRSAVDTSRKLLNEQQMYIS